MTGKLLSATDHRFCKSAINKTNGKNKQTEIMVMYEFSK